MQLVAFRVIPGHRVTCHSIGEYQSYYHCGRSVVGSRAIEAVMQEMADAAPDVFECAAFVDSVVSSFFRRSVPEDRNFDYKVSAVYSEMLHPHGGAIVFPSVKSSTGRNIAIPAAVFDAHFEVLFTHCIRVDSVPGFGIYKFSSIQACADFADDGDSRWGSEKQCPARWDRRGGFNVDPEYRGWCKGPSNRPAV